MTLLHSSYLAAFGAAALACLAGAWHACRLSDPDTRRELQALLLTSAGWAGAYVGYLWAPTPLAQAGFYMVGFVLGFATVWAWLSLRWACSSSIPVGSRAYGGRGRTTIPLPRAAEQASKGP